jgi:DNA-directed RNA polymerase subunit B
MISISTSKTEIMDTLFDLGVKSVLDSSEHLRREGIKVFIDGHFLGYVENGELFLETFKKLRREGNINPYVSISLYSPKVERASSRIYISTSSGRVIRPLVIVENGKPLITQEVMDQVSKGTLTWQDLLREGLIELVDANEEENCYIAIDLKSLGKNHTHIELTPSSMLGVTASVIPYPEHNQSPRNTYEAAMAKQSLGFPTSTFPFSTYVREHLLGYPQSPLVNTRSTSLLNIQNRPTGQNCIVAVLSYEGYNIEDAIILNKHSIDMGLFRTFFYRIYEAEAKQYLGGMKDEFTIPSPDTNIRGYRGEKYYRILENDGVVMQESKVSGGDVIMGRTSPPRFIEEYKEFDVKGPYKRDTSIAVRPSESGVVDIVFISESVDGGKMFKVRVRDQRIPEIGDKFASRHGQKGIIGLLVNQEDMPYTEDGIVPDIIINPHAFPSRMTVGQFIESLAGKAAALKGLTIDGTAFAGEKVENLSRMLSELGFQSSGKQTMFDGKTGKKFESDIFLGAVYYQKLHHMVADKIHARARGQVQMLTKQPTEGRARGGGLRFGEMERDCLIAYGASMVLKDRLLDEADKTEVHVCEKCGLIAYYDARQRKYNCKICGESGNISTVVIAYAFKLLLQEMMSLNIAPRLLLKNKV